MPIIYKTITADIRLGVWEVKEPEAFFLETYSYAPDELGEIDQRHVNHRLQLLASRAVLYDMKLSDSPYKIVKDNHGKPHIVNIQGDISFTHSHSHAGAIYAKSKLVGMDIQISTGKINRIAKKFISKEEFDYIDLHDNKDDYYHVLWGAKESLYKAYGRQKVEFRDNLFVDSFVYHPKGGHTTGRVKMHDYEGDFEIYYTKIGDYYMVYCIEKKLHESID